ncbi:MAG: type II secretion system F family protein [Epsilonproteobacteria bacterium]|nr:type II secretion system F family protein [Campylobacterota bacterium]
MYFLVEYIYRGRKDNMVVKAKNRFEASAVAKRNNKDIVVINIEETAAPLSEVFENLKKEFIKKFNKKLNIEEKISIIRQIAVMTDAGIPINDVLEDIVKNSSNPAVKEIFGAVVNDINAGKSMSQALEPHKEAMGHIVMAMTKLGETTGNFPEAYHQLANILESIRDNRNKFMKAIRYPITVISALVIAFVVVIIVVVPKFKDIFKELGADLPLATKFLLAVESFFRNYGVFIVLFLVGLVFVVRYLYKNNEAFRYQVDKILANPKFYLIGDIVYLSNMYSYTLVFGALVKAGIPVSEALNTAIGVVENRYIRKELESININIGRGMSLSEAFEQTGLFENMLLQMIRAGESSGQLDRMLEKVRDYYNMRFQNLVDNLSAYIEPIMIALIAGLVLLLALGIFMPMWDLGKAAQGG